MEFRILGPLEVVREGSVLPTPPNKPRALLALLLLRRGEAVGVDELADDLWGEQPPATATKSIQVYVSQLRKSLGEGVLETRGRGYALVADDDAVDAARFERLLDRGTELRAAGEPKAAAEVLTEALTLWRGPALADFTYEPWAQPEIARLDDLRLAALEERIDADLEVGRHATLVGELTGLVERNPGRERLLGQLMLALYRSGRQTEALDVYREQRRRLDEELGLEPSPALRELEAAMLRQDPSLGRPARTATAGSRGRSGKLVAVAGAALLAVVGIGGAAVLGQEDETPAVAAVKPLTAPSCSPMDYRPGTRPRHLIVSDQQSDLGEFSTQVAAAVEFVIRERGFEAGGTPVAYQVCDSDPSKCDEAAKDYVDNPSVIGVIGPLTSTCAEAQIPVANRARPGPLALVSPTTTRVGLTRPSPVTPDEPDSLYPTGIRNFVRVQAADDFQLAALAMYAKRSGVRSFFLIADGQECDTDGGPFGAAAQRLGLQVAGCAFYNDTSGNPAHLARRVARSRADAVYLPITAAADGGRLIRALRARAGAGSPAPRRGRVLGSPLQRRGRPRRERHEGDRRRGRSEGADRPRPRADRPLARDGGRTAPVHGVRRPGDGAAARCDRALGRDPSIRRPRALRQRGPRRRARRLLGHADRRHHREPGDDLRARGRRTGARPAADPAARARGVTAGRDRARADERRPRGRGDAGRPGRRAKPRRCASAMSPASAGRGPSPGTTGCSSTSPTGPTSRASSPRTPPSPSRAPDGPRGEVRYIAPVSGPEHAERVCDAARERWPRAYARYDEVLLDQVDGRDLTCVRP